jgi:formamidopyrimidine-DNA glycosylase
MSGRATVGRQNYPRGHPVKSPAAGTARLTCLCRDTLCLGYTTLDVPELPEVETVRSQLEPEVVGRRIAHAEVLDERWTRPEPPDAVAEELAGLRVEEVGRRGKYLIVRFHDRRALVMHLRMTGNLLLRPPGSGGVADLMETERFGGPRLYESHPEARHLRARIEFDDGAELWFTDARRFGHGVLLAEDEIEPYFASRLGIEPLSGELTAEGLATIAEGRRAPLKSFLLNQTGIAGIGNIYADEALFRAELHPLSPAGSMKLEHCEALRIGIVEALEAALANGGSSIDDYRNAFGEQGSMQDEFRVHTREGEECVRCGGTIRRVVVSGRSTYFCPDCQTRLRARPRRRARA